MSGELGGFQDVREEVDRHSMVGLLAYAKRYWPRLSVGIVASLLTRLARLVPPIVVGTAIDRVVQNNAGPDLLAELGLITAQPATSEAARLALLYRLALIAIVAYVVRSITRFVSRYLLQSTAQKIQRDLRNDTYDHMQRLSLDFFSNHQTGAMMSILNNDINRLERFLNDEIRQIIRVIATVGGIGIVMVWYSPPLALIALLPVPVIGLTSAKFLTWIEPKYKRIRETVARLNSRLENNIGGAKVIKAFDRYEFELGRVAEQSETYHDEQVDAIRLRRAFFASIRLLTGVAFVGILLVGGSMVISDANRFAVGPIVVTSSIQAGAFATFFLYLQRMYAPMRRIGLTVNRYQRAKSSAERVFGVLGHEPTVLSPADPVSPASVEGRVEFDDVHFTYDTGDEVLSGVSLDVEPGETIGLAGETGAGKSTLVKLVPRFYDVDERSSSAHQMQSADVSGPSGSDGSSRAERRDGVHASGASAGSSRVERRDGVHASGASAGSSRVERRDGVDSGSVRVDGVDVREYELQSLREHVGVVEQDPYLFSGTVEENIGYGDLSTLDGDSGAASPTSSRGGDADLPDDRIVEAAEAAEADAFIRELPDGYDTQIGERGVKLSGGQRQRLAIARALLNDPAVIVLDEATSDVDTETEELIQQSLRRLTADRTAFVIAHRLSTIKKADRIVVMDDGEIDEVGSHEELVAAEGRYADLWATQADTAPSAADD